MEVIVKRFGRKTSIIKEEENKITIICGAKPLNNEANIEIERFFSKKFNKKVKIISGFTHKKKILKG